MIAITLLGGIAINTSKSVFLESNDKKEQKQNYSVYSFGYGNFGQLGIGIEQNKYKPEQIEELQGLDIVQISARNKVSACLTADGKVFTWGQSKSGVLGHNNLSSQNVTLPKQLLGLSDQKIKYIDVGFTHSAAINEKGELFTWGNNQHGKLGHNQEEQQKQDKIKYSFNPKTNATQAGFEIKKVKGEIDGNVIQVACGKYHTIALTENGSVYTWGTNQKGVLGYSSQSDVQVPKKVQYFESQNIVKIDCGADFNIALTSDGKLYSWGNNDYGQTGNGNESFFETPTLIYSLQKIKIQNFSCGDYFAGAISNDGNLYTWGYGNDGQLGHQNRSDLKSPYQVNFDKKLIQLSCGSGHTGIITDKGELYMFGRGKEGQLGMEDLIESSAGYRTKPKLVESFKNKKVVNVKCGGEHTLAIILN